MSTGDLKTNIYLKKFLSQQDFKNNTIDFLHKTTKDALKRIYELGGTFKGGLISSDTADTFDLSTPLEGVNSQGLDAILDPTEADDVPFENTTAIDYHVGIKPIEIANGTEINVKTGKIEYIYFKEVVGIKGQPNLVVDDGDSTMTITVDSVTETGVSNAGRTVRIWLKSLDDGGTIGPQTEVDPFEDVVVTWDGSNNRIATTGKLGQSTISTTVTEYEIALLGPTVKRNTDLRLDSSIIFIGIITGDNGVSPSVFDQTDRIILPSLYDFLVEHNADGTHNLDSVLFDIIIGSTAEVTSGAATHTINTFASAVANFNTITILKGTHTLTGNVSLTEQDLIIVSQAGAIIDLDDTHTFTSTGVNLNMTSQIINTDSPALITISGAASFLKSLNTNIDRVITSNGVIAICTGNGGGFKKNIFDAGSSGSALTIDWRNGKDQKFTQTDHCVLTFINPSEDMEHTLTWIEDATIEYNLVFPGDVSFRHDDIINKQGVRKYGYGKFKFQTGILPAISSFGTSKGNFSTTTSANRVTISPDGKYIIIIRSGNPFVEAHKWDGQTLGPKLADPSPLSGGNTVDATFTPDNRFVVITNVTASVMDMYEWDGGFGPAIANPSSLPSGTSNGSMFSPDGDFFFLFDSLTPFIHGWPWDGSSFGTKLSDPSTLPAAQVLGGFFTLDSSHIILDVSDATTGVIAYAFSSGFGSKVTDPVSLPSASRNFRLTPNGKDIIFDYPSSPYLSSYPWDGSSFGTRVDASATSSAILRNISPDGTYILLSRTTAIIARSWNGSSFGSEIDSGLTPTSVSRIISTLNGEDIMGVVDDGVVVIPPPRVVKNYILNR